MKGEIGIIDYLLSVNFRSR